jgi:hypothetical protein
MGHIYEQSYIYKKKHKVYKERCIPRNSRPFRASTHVSAASYRAARSSVMLYFFFNFFDTKYIAAAPAYLTVIFSVKLKLPAFTGEVYKEIKIIG